MLEILAWVYRHRMIIRSMKKERCAAFDAAGRGSDKNTALAKQFFFVVDDLENTF
jgi:hypothetical protein